MGRRWNPLTTAQTGWQWTSVRRDTNGTAYVRVEGKKGIPSALWPIEADVQTHYDPTVTASPVRYIVGTGDKFTPPPHAPGDGMLLEPVAPVRTVAVDVDGKAAEGTSLRLLGGEVGVREERTRFVDREATGRAVLGEREVGDADTRARVDTLQCL
jgi:hypothetical protein